MAVAFILPVLRIAGLGGFDRAPAAIPLVSLEFHLNAKLQEPSLQRRRRPIQRRTERRQLTKHNTRIKQVVDFDLRLDVESVSMEDPVRSEVELTPSVQELRGRRNQRHRDGLRAAAR